MTNIQELYDICSRENITIDFIDCPKCGAISLFGAGGCAIGIDSQTPARLLKERTAHEIGHCVKGAFYNRYATADNISQHEYRADKWAIAQSNTNYRIPTRQYSAGLPLLHFSYRS